MGCQVKHKSESAFCWLMNEPTALLLVEWGIFEIDEGVSGQENEVCDLA